MTRGSRTHDGDTGEAEPAKEKTPSRPSPASGGAEPRTAPPGRRRLLLIVGSVSIAAIVVAALVVVVWPRTPAERFPNLTVENDARSPTIRWTLPSNNSEVPLGTFQLTSTIVDNDSGNESELQLYADFFGYHVAGADQVDFGVLVAITGNFSTDIQPSSVSVDVSNLQTNTTPAINVEIAPGGPAGSEPTNLSAYDVGGADGGFSGWGQVVDSTGFDNLTSSHFGRFHFIFPLQIVGIFEQPAPQATSITQLTIQCALGSLGQPVYCEVSAWIETTNSE